MCLVYRSKLVENYSKPSIANFGRSLFGGYCPTYVPDFVLHGMPSDEKLRQSLMAELTHAVQVKDCLALFFRELYFSVVISSLKSDIPYILLYRYVSQYRKYMQNYL